MIKILFLEPKIDSSFRFFLKDDRVYEEPPLWSLYLATYLKEKIPDIKIDILNEQFFSIKKLEEWAKDNKPHFVGISPKVNSYNSSIRSARIFKKHNAKIILGGVHAFSLSKEILENRGPFSDDYCIDAIIQKDGEEALFKYIQGNPLKNINNLIWHNGKKIIENKVKLSNLELLPIPNRSLANINHYLKKSDILSILSQKGCSWRNKSGGCIFCAQDSNILRFRNPSDVWEEIHFLRKKYNVKKIWDLSENFLNDLNWVVNFWKVSKKYKDKPNFKIYLNLSEVNNKSIRILQELNVVESILGVEAGSLQSLRNFNKGTNTKLIKSKLECLHNHGIGTFHCYVFGAPKETQKTLEETIEFAISSSKNKYHIGSRFTVLIPYPGSVAWQMLLIKKSNKYLKKDIINWEEAIKDWINTYCNIDYDLFIKQFNKVKELERCLIGAN